MASSCNFIIVLVILSIVTINGCSGQTKGCGGMIEANNGTLELEPSHRPCLWLIALKNKTGVRLELSPSVVTPILVIPQQNVSHENLTSVWINGSKEVFYNYEGKSLAIMAPYRTERSNLSWTGLASDIPQVTLSTKFVNESNGTLEWKHGQDGMDQIFWAFHHRTAGLISWDFETLLPACDPPDPCESVYLAVLEIMGNGTMSEIEKTCDGPSKFSIKVGKGSQVLVQLHINAPVEATTRFQVTWKYDEHFKRNVQGIIAGSWDSGISVIPFNSTQTTIANSRYVNGVAFNWNSSRVYWLKFLTGIMRANLNGSVTETLLSDKAHLKGLAIDPVSENLYFGNRSSKTIRVCNENGNKCSTIANSSDLSDVYDLAVHWSKGILFWSTFDDKLVRANLDGSNLTVVLNRTGVMGIEVDEEDDRLYCGSTNGIKSTDLDGRDPRQLPNVNTITKDVAIDGENIYYNRINSNSDESRIEIISKLGTNPRLVANLTDARNVALYGKRTSSLPRNPCEKSNCAHLCVLSSPSSARCLCPDGEKLASDGTTCLIPQLTLNVL